MDLCAVCEGPGGVFAVAKCSGCDRAVCANHFPMHAWLNDRGGAYAIFPGVFADTHVPLTLGATDPEALQEHDAYVRAWVARDTRCFPCRHAEGTEAVRDLRSLRRSTWGEMLAYVQAGTFPKHDADAPLDTKARLEQMIAEFRSAVGTRDAPGAHAGEWVFALGFDRELRIRTGGTYRLSMRSRSGDVVQRPRESDLIPALEQMTRLLLSHGLDLPG